jgi:adenine-specific DNA-methyltransferase
VPITSHRRLDEVRREATEQLDASRRVALGQFMTPSIIAEFMASLFRQWPDQVRLLDPGAGVGSLTEAFSARFFGRAPRGAHLDIMAYEIDPLLAGYLAQHVGSLEARGRTTGHKISSTIVKRDFIVEASFALSFGGPRFTHVILNPPYKKIGADSEHRRLLRKIGIETVNLYTAFLALAVALTDDGGEIVAIVPRSFCNGTYFRPFRKWLLERATLNHIHVFESRTKAFSDDKVLQENVILHLQRGAAQGMVTISSSHDASFSDYVERNVSFSDIVKPADGERFIYIPTVETNGSDALFAHRLSDLSLDVATGPVVDFRVRDYWLDEPNGHCAPLLYTHHFVEGKLQWPRTHRKPNAVAIADETVKWLLPKGWYTITKRFSSKEERRRLVAYVVDPRTLPYELYGFENHLNVIHAGKRGLSPDLARGLAVFLNSTIIDQHFRTFSGHTQVNATDLRSMPFPSKDKLLEFGRRARGEQNLTQEEIDILIASHHAS